MQWILFLLTLDWCAVTVAYCMTSEDITLLRRQTIDLFYHGFDAYMLHAFPEDELRPLTCSPLTRDALNPGHIEVNDVLGNYSLTLIDSLSTLAILASAPKDDLRSRKPLRDFQDGIASLVELYGDGTGGPEGQGSRSRGFDLDSKVQVFETVIRGVGGLVSAHQFAVGDLPIRGYTPKHSEEAGGIIWDNGLVYKGQLLRLAYDLSERLVPAFSSVTGLPYPRVNLRHGIPFYENSPINANSETGTCESNPKNQEVTETCSAGAGSLVLEFTVLSRLTGDNRFELLAKKAFQAVWDRRSSIGLIGAGIDAETGDWAAPYTGIGAGIDSFFEYAMKAHVLFSTDKFSSNDSIDFYGIWREAHAGIKHHLYRGHAYQHPHYIQGDLNTGATRAFWIDSLSAYYPGLLTLSGDLEEAVSTHMLYVALWTRYSAMPERWNTASGTIDSGLRWWGGRPEFIESNWYLYRATQDPWFLHVAEMVLKDVSKRCKVACGWAGLEDVRTGELKDRMESFFLGETAKYMYLTFDPDHPLNKWDAPFVLTTEGHPVVIPKNGPTRPSSAGGPTLTHHHVQLQCPLPPPLAPLSVSPTVLRHDFFHAASLARLELVSRVRGINSSVESSQDDHNIASRLDRSPNNHTYYPWTLPAGYIPLNGLSSKMVSRITFDLSFPTIPNTIAGPLSLRRVPEGISVGSLSALKFGMIRETIKTVKELPGGLETEEDLETFRIQAVSNLLLGRDEKVLITTETMKDLNPVDPYFTRHREISVADIVIDTDYVLPFEDDREVPTEIKQELLLPPDVFKEGSAQAEGWLKQLQNILQQQVPVDTFLSNTKNSATRQAEKEPSMPMLAGSTATGIGAGPLPDVVDVASVPVVGSLIWSSIFISDETCDEVLPADVPRNHQIIVVKRGGCTFSQKLRNIPSFAPTKKSLQLVIVVSFKSSGEEADLIRPLLDEQQFTPAGVVRPQQIPLLMLEGGQIAYDMLRTARGVGIRRRYHFSSQGLRISNLHVV